MCCRYSFNYGNVHFVAFSVEQPFNLTDPQGLTCVNHSYPVYLCQPTTHITPLGLTCSFLCCCSGQWLLADLQYANNPANRSVRPWIVAYAHRSDEPTKDAYFVSVFDLLSSVPLVCLPHSSACCHMHVAPCGAATSFGVLTLSPSAGLGRV